MTGEIAHKGDKAPIQAGQRWHVERTNAWHNAFNRLQRYYERNEDVIGAFFDRQFSKIRTGFPPDYFGPHHPPARCAAVCSTHPSIHAGHRSSAEGCRTPLTYSGCIARPS
jgi:transposase